MAHRSNDQCFSPTSLPRPLKHQQYSPLTSSVEGPKKGGKDLEVWFFGYHASRPFLGRDYFLTCGNTIYRILCNLRGKYVSMGVCRHGFIEEFMYCKN